MLDDPTRQSLIDAAIAVRAHAHAPYSHFHVGAAVLDEQGRIHAGCNVENAAYPVSQCAEATALGVMVAAGGRRARALVVVGHASGGAWVTPCGGCRQRLREFADPDTPVLIVGAQGLQATLTLDELLPHSFGPDHLSST
ncbi:cytidine deaminase [Ideonella sp. A 288]|uniref:cytidine deaminase n=1 Tax=Ideonella sp. A 288 TaxID=1962181 RepID=UPI000B4B2325|nr:cytidine deaminase [Ideonella sp. A 288]